MNQPFQILSDRILPAILSTAFIVSTLTAGIPYWIMLYHTLNLPNALYGPGLLVLFVAAAVVRVLGVSTFWRSAVILAGSLPAVVLVRMVVDTMADPTSHNLWPLEVIIASALGGMCSLPGATVGWMIAKLRSIAAR